MVNSATIHTQKDHEPEVRTKAPLELIEQVVIKFVDPQTMRYDTCGDWRVVEVEETPTLLITVARGSNPLYAYAVAFHEYIESVACLAAGVTDEDVDNFDIHGPGALLDDPGRDPRAPYHRQHILAGAMERNLANHLGINWDEYDKEITEGSYGNEATDERAVRDDSERGESAEENQ